MSERLNSWDANQAAHDKGQFEDALFGEAGKSDFSEEARTRAEEAGAYEDHLEGLKGRGDDYDVMSDGRMDSVDRDIQADPRLRRAAMMANNIRELGNQEVRLADSAKLTERYKDLQDKLEDLLLSYESDSTLHSVQKEEIMKRIIDMTVEAPADATTNEASSAEQSDVDSQDASAEKESADTNGNDEEDAGDSGEAGKDTYEAPKMTADEIRAKRARMVKSGLPALEVGNMSDDEIDSYNLVESRPEETEERDADTEDDKAEDNETDDGSSDSEGTGEPIQPTLPGLEDLEVDTGEDIDDLPEDEEGDDTLTVDTRSRLVKARAEARELMRNWRHPLAYLGGRMNAAAAARAEARANGELKNNRRWIIGGVLAAAAFAGTALWLQSRGHDASAMNPNQGGGGSGGSGGGLDLYKTTPHPNEGALPNGPLRGYEINNAGNHGAAASEWVRVKPGDGEIRVTQTILDNHGITVDAKAAQRIGEHAGVDLLQRDSNYDDAQSTLNRIGGRPGKYRTQPNAAQALIDAAHELGYK